MPPAVGGSYPQMFEEKLGTSAIVANDVGEPDHEGGRPRVSRGLEKVAAHGSRADSD